MTEMNDAKVTLSNKYDRPKGVGCNPEADEISPEDLEAAAEMFDKVKARTTADQEVSQFMKDEYGIDISIGSIDGILGEYACCRLSLQSVIERRISRGLVPEVKVLIEQLVEEQMGKLKSFTPCKPKRKPFVIRVNVDAYYEIDPDTLPPWADELGVEKLVEAAFENHNQALTLAGLSDIGVLKQNPSELSLNTVSIA